MAVRIDEQRRDEIVTLPIQVALQRTLRVGPGAAVNPLLVEAQRMLLAFARLVDAADRDVGRAESLHDQVTRDRLSGGVLAALADTDHVSKLSGSGQRRSRTCASNSARKRRRKPVAA